MQGSAGWGECFETITRFRNSNHYHNYMKRISMSVLAIGAVAAVVAGTGAFFSDTAASQGNVFNTQGVDVAMSTIAHVYKGTAGPGEVALDPTGYVYNGTTGSFSFADLKPLDWGSLTFEASNNENEAYVCAYIEGEAPQNSADFALYDNLQFYQGGTQLTPGNWFSLGTVGAGGSASYGVDYCFGEPTVNSGGITHCGMNPAFDYNTAQNATFSADFYLFAIQTRNNTGFTCDALTFNPDEEDFVDIDYNYLPPAPLVKVGAETLAYVAPDPASCTLTVDASQVSPVPPIYNTLTGAEADALDGNTICVDTGNYPETVTVNVPNVTIVGLNDPMGGNKATLTGRLDVSANGVTVRGIEFTNPDAGYVLVINGANDTEIASNSFQNIGTTLSAGSAQAIYYVAGGANASDVHIHHNTINNVGNIGMSVPGSGSSAKGIFVGDSTAAFSLSSLVIEHNTIANVSVKTTDYASGGRGAYGILINYGVGSTGSVIAPKINNNTISNLEGYWTTAVGLETKTPTAVVTNNAISNLTDHLTVTPGASGVGVHFEGNTFGDVSINDNNFAPSVAYGVALHPSNPAITVNATNNWWGDADPSDNVIQSAGTIDYTPFELVAFPLN